MTALKNFIMVNGKTTNEMVSSIFANSINIIYQDLEFAKERMDSSTKVSGSTTDVTVTA